MNRIVQWASVAVLVTLMVGTIYGVAQQIERQGADDTGRRLASQVAAELAGGGSATLDALPRVDLGASLAPFVIVYDRANAAIAGNGYLDGALATVPAGVLAAARASGSNHVSWQPAPGLRFATVELRAGDQVVLAGQSLTPSEDRTDALGILMLAAWLSMLVVVTAGLILSRIAGRNGRAARRPSGNR